MESLLIVIFYFFPTRYHFILPFLSFPSLLAIGIEHRLCENCEFEQGAIKTFIANTTVKAAGS